MFIFYKVLARNRKCPILNSMKISKLSKASTSSFSKRKSLIHEERVKFPLHTSGCVCIVQLVLTRKDIKSSRTRNSVFPSPELYYAIHIPSVSQVSNHGNKEQTLLPNKRPLCTLCLPHLYITYIRSLAQPTYFAQS